MGGTRVAERRRVHRSLVLPGAVEPLGPRNGPPLPPGGPCTAPGPHPSPRVPDWPGSRCERRQRLCPAASTADEEKAEVLLIDRSKVGANRHFLLLRHQTPPGLSNWTLVICSHGPNVSFLFICHFSVSLADKTNERIQTNVNYQSRRMVYN